MTFISNIRPYSLHQLLVCVLFLTSPWDVQHYWPVAWGIPRFPGDSLQKDTAMHNLEYYNCVSEQAVEPTVWMASQLRHNEANVAPL